jgi:1,4-alpha-glucan branching enzyme
MYTHPGAKLLFMGNEFGQTAEWNYRSELQWELLEFDSHRMMRECVKDLNHLYRKQDALHEKQFDPSGFEWVDLDHREEAVVCFKRKCGSTKEDILVLLNMMPVVRHDWVVYVDGKGNWKEIFNSDLKKYWGTGDVFNPEIRSELVDKKLKRYKLTLNLPPLAGIVLK